MIMADEWSPGWSNAVFSLEERDRRWTNVRNLMARNSVDLIVCLPCTNSHDRGQADPRYLTQLGENSDETTVAFGIDGEVTAWHSRPGVWPSSNWFSDIRAAGRGTGGRTIVEWVKEHPRYERGAIAIAAMTSSFYAHVRADEGEVNWQSVEIIKKELPNATVVSATPILGEARYHKSEEEIEFLRKGTQVAETTMKAVIDYAHAGVPEREVFARMLYAYTSAGGSLQPMFGWISGPFGKTYHRVEQPAFRNLQFGDAIHIEIEGRWGGYVAQIDQTFSIGPASQEYKDVAKLAWEAFDRVVDKLKAGVTVGELVDAGRVTGMNGRGKANLTMHGRGTGDDGPGLFGTPPPAIRDFVIDENTVFVVKPSAQLEGSPSYYGWGDVVAVRKNGAERLGTRPQVLYEL
jgi:Xaa-Pro aminopeptidase